MCFSNTTEFVEDEGSVFSAADSWAGETQGAVNCGSQGKECLQLGQVTLTLDFGNVADGICLLKPQHGQVIFVDSIYPSPVFFRCPFFPVGSHIEFFKNYDHLTSFVAFSRHFVRASISET
jgi:hypothetical protein